MKTTFKTLVIALVALFSFGTASAQNAHFTDVVFSSDGLTVTGKVAGLGNKSGGVEVVYTAGVTQTKNCYNPGTKDTLVPGQTETLVISGGTDTKYYPGKNGQISFSITLTTDEMEAIFGDCPNTKWTTDMTVSILNSLAFTTDSGVKGTYVSE